MEVKVIQESNRTIGEIIGRVDTTTAGDFQSKVTAILEAKPAQVVLDCAQLEYISSAGLRALLIIAKNCKAADIDISLCSLTDFVVDVLETSGFDTFFKIKADRNS